jgi:hypothetical protein
MSDISGTFRALKCGYSLSIFSRASQAEGERTADIRGDDFHVHFHGRFPSHARKAPQDARDDQGWRMEMNGEENRFLGGSVAGTT